MKNTMKVALFVKPVCAVLEPEPETTLLKQMPL